LAKELAAAYPEVTHKIAVIANPVDVERFSRPPNFDRIGMRSSLGLMPNQLVFSFLALGDFARKGLDVIMEALTLLSSEDTSRARVLVIGGKNTEILAYKNKASRAGVAGNFQFVGFQKDPRPYLWVSDVFVFPSIYETFSLAIHQAAAAGLPVLTTAGLYGAEELIEHGRNGWLVARNPDTVGAALRHAIADRTGLDRMGISAQEAVGRCHVSVFLRQWRELLATVSTT
jgi:glycosyltransferase involved in cell wall biosynthesis